MPPLNLRQVEIHEPFLNVVYFQLRHSSFKVYIERFPVSEPKRHHARVMQLVLQYGTRRSTHNIVSNIWQFT